VNGLSMHAFSAPTGVKFDNAPPFGMVPTQPFNFPTSMELPHFSLVQETPLVAETGWGRGLGLGHARRGRTVEEVDGVEEQAGVAAAGSEAASELLDLVGHYLGAAPKSPVQRGPVTGRWREAKERDWSQAAPSPTPPPASLPIRWSGDSSM
jgi:hypothetical protein